MKVAQLTTRNSFLDFASILRQGQPFRTHGALKGIVGSASKGFGGWGQLDTSEPDSFGRYYSRDFHMGVIEYTVTSYDTPIAYMTTERVWRRNTDTYSRTTTKHQNKIGAAISKLTD